MRPAALGTPAGSDAALRDRLLSAVPPLRAAALALTGDPACADDLVQDTLLRAWTATEGLPHGADLTPWLIAAVSERFRSGQGRRAGTGAGARDEA